MSVEDSAPKVYPGQHARSLSRFIHSLVVDAPAWVDRRRAVGLAISLGRTLGDAYVRADRQRRQPGASESIGLPPAPSLGPLPSALLRSGGAPDEVEAEKASTLARGSDNAQAVELGPVTLCGCCSCLDTCSAAVARRLGAA